MDLGCLQGPRYLYTLWVPLWGEYFYTRMGAWGSPERSQTLSEDLGTPCGVNTPGVCPVGALVGYAFENLLLRSLGFRS
jgi:hypothetical protein